MKIYSFAIVSNDLMQIDKYFCKDPTPFDIFLADSLELQDVDYSQCDPCHFTVRNEAQDSSPRDLLIAAAVKNIANEQFFARSIRTVQSKCHVVIICDEEAMSKLPKERYEAAVKCGVQFCVVPIKNWHGGYWGQATVAYYYVLAFLLRNRGKFNRIIFQDLYDSIFQGDPFTSDLLSAYNEIHVTHEFHLPSSPFMRKQYNKYKITVPEEFRNEYYKNSSHFAGYAEIFLKFMLLFVSVNYFKKGWNDQVTANYLNYYGLLQEYGLNYSDPGKANRFINMINAHGAEKASLGNYHAILSNNQKYAVCIHHTWFKIRVFLDIAKFCPIQERNPVLVKKYFGKCKKSCIKRIMHYYEKLDNKTY